jgi:hypothetical protein
MDRYACPYCGYINCPEADGPFYNSMDDPFYRKSLELISKTGRLAVNLCNPGGRELHIEKSDGEVIRVQLSDQCFYCDYEQLKKSLRFKIF